MGTLKKGDEVFFSSASRLVNSGTVESIDGQCIVVKAEVLGEKHMMTSQVFSTKEELVASDAYRKAWCAQQSRRRRMAMDSGMARMASFRF